MLLIPSLLTYLIILSITLLKFDNKVNFNISFPIKYNYIISLAYFTKRYFCSYNVFVFNEEYAYKIKICNHEMHCKTKKKLMSYPM